jgi:hypothetical protein
MATPRNPSMNFILVPAAAASRTVMDACGT